MKIARWAQAGLAALVEAKNGLAELLPEKRDLVAMAAYPRQDLLAGLTVAVVALPLSLAFGVASGMGAQAGLVTAVVAGIVAAVFGGSNFQVSGPTGAMTVVLVPIVHRYGATGVLMVGAMAGIILVAMAVARLGGYVRFLPVSLVEGFTAGIAVVISLQQVPAALGVESGDSDKVWKNAVTAMGDFSREPHVATLTIALVVTGLILAGGRWRPGVPFSLIGVAAASILARVTDLDLTVVGDLPASLPAPSLDFVDVAAVSSLLAPALAIAALAALESLLCATVADGMTVSDVHDPDRELFGQGLANMAVPLFGGIPATAAIARTAVNIRAGARSRLAAVFHSFVLLVVVFAAAPLVSTIPMAALAGVLFATCARMVEASSIRMLLRSTRSDALIVVLTFVVTVMVDLVAAVGVGLAVATVLALRSVARSVRLERVDLERGDRSEEEHQLLSEHIVAYRVDGALFFGAAHRVLVELPSVVDVKVVILRMSKVTTMDATGARLLGDAITKLRHRGVVVMMSGASPQHHALMSSLGIGDELRREGLVFSDTPEAIAAARRLLPHDSAE